MELKLRDGDYVSDGCGGFERVSGAEETLQRALFKLTARRGGFAAMPELGSRLYTLPRISAGGRENAARQFAAEALYDEDVAIDDIAVYEADGGLNVHVSLAAGDSAAAAEISF